MIIWKWLYLQAGLNVNPSGRIRFETAPDEVILHCKSAEKADAGKYLAILKNEVGSDMALVTLTVVGKCSISNWSI